MDNNTLIKVKNRNNGSTGYSLPDSHVTRNFAPNQEKDISLGELKELSYIPGGEYIIQNLLIIENEEALKELNLEVEPEYFYSEDKVREILFNNDNLDEFLDFLDFAPEGAIEIVKQIAVDEEVPDTRKRKAISEKTGFNIDAAINLNQQLNAEAEVEAPQEKKERRVAKTEKGSGRRAAAPSVPSYKVVDKK
jgi:hypothetical protein